MRKGEDSSAVKKRRQVRPNIDDFQLIRDLFTERLQRLTDPRLEVSGCSRRLPWTYPVRCSSGAAARAMRLVK